MGHGAKGADLFLALSLTIMRDQADFDILFMDIHPSTRLMHNMHGDFLLHGGPLPQRTRCGASAPRTSLLCVLPARGRQLVVLQRCARQTLLRARSTSVSPTTMQRRGLASIPQGCPIFMVVVHKHAWGILLKIAPLFSYAVE